MKLDDASKLRHGQKIDFGGKTGVDVVKPDGKTRAARRARSSSRRRTPASKPRRADGRRRPQARREQGQLRRAEGGGGDLQARRPAVLQLLRAASWPCVGVLFIFVAMLYKEKTHLRDETRRRRVSWPRTVSAPAGRGRHPSGASTGRLRRRRMRGDDGRGGAEGRGGLDGREARRRRGVVGGASGDGGSTRGSCPEDGGAGGGRVWKESNGVGGRGQGRAHERRGLGHRRRGARRLGRRSGAGALVLAPARGAAPLDDERAVGILVAGQTPAELRADERVVGLRLRGLLPAPYAGLPVPH